MKGAFAITFLLGAFPTQTGADPCTGIGAAYKLKANPASVYCKDAGTDKVSCGGCCEVKPNTCKAHTTGSCGADKMRDSAKEATALTDTTKYATTCCKARPEIPMTCKSARISLSNCGAGNQFPDPAKDDVTIQKDKSDYVAKCCTDNCKDCCRTLAAANTQCEANHKFKTSAAQTAATAANYKTTCCEAEPAKGTCAGFSCSAGMKAVATASTKVCAGAKCIEMECCEADTTKCGGMTTSCTGNTFKDKAKFGTAATAANFQATCCSAQSTCAAFKTAMATASGTLLPSLHAMTLLCIAMLFGK